MQPEERDAAYLWDMLDASQAMLSFTEGMRFEEYLADRQTQFAVERALEIVGEAAGHLSNSFREAHPEVPWRSIIAQRNVLAHEYGASKQNRIWNVVRSHIPELIANLRCYLPPRHPGRSET